MKNLILVLIACFGMSCMKAQKIEKPKELVHYLGTKITANSIVPPKYKFHEKGQDAIGNVKLVPSGKSNNKEVSSIIRQINDNNSVQKKDKALVLEKINKANQPGLKPFQNNEYYEIDNNQNQIIIRYLEPQGLIHALASLDFEINQKQGLRKIKKIKNWPDIAIRSLQVNLKAMDPEIIKQVVLRMWRGHFNHVLYSIHNSVKFEAVKAHARPQAMNVSDFKSICEFSRLFGIEPIPHFAFLSHQNKSLIQQSIAPSLLYNEQTLDPRNDSVYSILFKVIDECIQEIQPKAIHIGHDEVIGHTAKQIEKHGPILPSNLFLQNVKRLNSYLQKKKVETWMWGDMLIYAADFPNMHPGSFNAPSSYKWLIDSIPKNIIICDWHYKHYKGKLQGKLDFSSTAYFLNKGFKVIGASYNVPEMTEQFANYVKNNKSENCLGMIGTTWHKLLKGSIPNKKNSDNMQSFDRILQKSSSSYWGQP